MASELERIQKFIHEECLRHRELMRELREVNFLDSSTFIRFTKDLVERFQRETGISTRFVSELDEVKMPPQVCRELADIFQHGLGSISQYAQRAPCPSKAN